MFFAEINPFVRQSIVGTLNRYNTCDVCTKIKTVDSRLFYIISGGGYMSIEGVRYPIVQGSVILFSAGTEYVWEIENVKYYSVNFDYSHSFSHIKETFHPFRSENFKEKQIIERVDFEDEQVLNKPVVLKKAPVLEQIIGQITTEFCIGGAYTDMFLTSLLKSAVITVVRMAKDDHVHTKIDFASLVRNVISYINMHYDSLITNESIAEAFHFNSTYLNRIFKSYTGSSLHAFLLNRRITAAMEMLCSQSPSVGEVAEKCGFGSLHHFTKTFKNRTGMTPSQYRNQ